MENDNQEKVVEVNYQPYIKKNYFFSLAELKFYELLKEVLGDQYLLFSKVRISDLIQSKYGKDKYLYFNKIKSKHVDFVICNKDPIQPRLIVELDDSSHNAHSRQERDNFVDEAFANAGIPIVHIKVQQEYDRNKLIEQIHEAYDIKYVIKEKKEEEKNNSSNGCLSYLGLVLVLMLFNSFRSS